jgi:asparagine synthetase B (glutamine-hydrolysing)
MSPKADVDSESIPAAVSHHGWDRLEKAMAMLDGHFACALFDKRYPRELALVKGPGSPLCYIRTADFIVWASTAGAILYAWRKAFGTPPSLKRVVDMRAEGKILRVESALFRTTGFKIRKPSYQVKPYKPLAKTAYATSNDHWYKADPKPKRDPLALPPAQVEQAASVLSFDDEALVKCDDCGDWQPWDNMRIVGWENLYCDLCADFAVGSGLYPSSTKVRQIEDITDRQSEYGFAD